MKKKTKENWILFMNFNAYPCVVGGKEIFNHYLLDELSNFLNIHVLTFCNNYTHNGSLTIHQIRKPRLQKFMMPLKVFWFVAKNKQNINKIHVSYSFGLWTHIVIYPLIKAIFGIEYMITIHDGNLTNWLPKWPYQWFFKKARNITCVSKGLILEYEKRLGRNDIIYTPPLIPFKIINEKNLYRKKWQVEQKEFVILYVGSFLPLKSVDTLIKAIADFPKHKILELNMKVLIAGDGPMKRELENISETNGLTKVVKFLGNVDHHEIFQLYNLADIYVICSEYEGFPISILEAFANKLPCISSDGTGLKEISENNRNSLLFQCGEAKDLASKIKTLSDNMLLRKEISNNGYDFYCRLYSFEIVLEKMKELLLDE